MLAEILTSLNLKLTTSSKGTTAMFVSINMKSKLCYPKSAGMFHICQQRISHILTAVAHYLSTLGKTLIYISNGRHVFV
jgi:hypothetical protein